MIIITISPRHHLHQGLDAVRAPQRYPHRCSHADWHLHVDEERGEQLHADVLHRICRICACKENRKNDSKNARKFIKNLTQKMPNNAQKLDTKMTQNS